MNGEMMCWGSLFFLGMEFQTKLLLGFAESFWELSRGAIVVNTRMRPDLIPYGGSVTAQRILESWKQPCFDEICRIEGAGKCSQGLPLKYVAVDAAAALFSDVPAGDPRTC